MWEIQEREDKTLVREIYRHAKDGGFNSRVHALEMLCSGMRPNANERGALNGNCFPGSPRQLWLFHVLAD